jgi:VanZ family protein
VAAARQRPIATKAALIAAVIAAVIVYGSLYPFEFQAHGGLDRAVRSLLATWPERTSRGDIISNVLLYIPFGIFAVNALGRPSRAMRIGLVTAAGLLLSVGVELTQFYEHARNSTMSDVYCNTAGTFLGAIAGAVFHVDNKLPLVKTISARPIPVLLLAAYGGDRLFPYVPAIDLHKYWDALKPLVFMPTATTAAGVFHHIAAWLVVAVLLESLFGGERRRLVFAMLVPAVLIARILIVGTILSPAEVYGAALAFVLWPAVLSHLPFRVAVVAVLLVGDLVLQSLAPFQFLPTARPFGWIPFLSFMQGSIEVNVRSMFAKVFSYGSLLWLLTRSGWSLGTATIFSAATVLALRYAQVYLPGRSAEITDCLIVLILALVMRLVRDDASQRGKAPAGAAAPSR